MLGALVIIVVLLAILSLIFMATGAIVAVVLGWPLWRDGETRADGSELIALNR